VFIQSFFFDEVAPTAVHLWSPQGYVVCFNHSHSLPILYHNGSGLSRVYTQSFCFFSR